MNPATCYSRRQTDNRCCSLLLDCFARAPNSEHGPPFEASFLFSFPTSVLVRTGAAPLSDLQPSLAQLAFVFGLIVLHRITYLFVYAATVSFTLTRQLVVLFHFHLLLQ